MHDVDVGSIGPSTRDLLQVISTRRRSLALLALLGADNQPLADCKASKLWIDPPLPKVQDDRLGGRLWVPAFR